MNSREAGGAVSDLEALLEKILDRLDELEEKVDGGHGYSYEERIEELENATQPDNVVSHDDLNELRIDIERIEGRLDGLED